MFSYYSLANTLKGEAEKQEKENTERKHTIWEKYWVKIFLNIFSAFMLMFSINSNKMFVLKVQALWLSGLSISKCVNMLGPRPKDWHRVGATNLLWGKSTFWSSLQCIFIQTAKGCREESSGKENSRGWFPGTILLSSNSFSVTFFLKCPSYDPGNPISCLKGQNLTCETHSKCSRN